MSAHPASDDGGAMNRIEPNNHNPSTAAWVVQSWVSFAVSVGVTIVGIAWLPTDPWVRAFLALGLLYAVTSSLSLAKTIRDQHESQRLISRLDEARVEELLTDFNPLMPR